MKKSLVVTCLAVMLAACGGGGESTPGERPSGVIEGTAFDNLLKNANVYAYSLTGELLGEGITNEKGIYSVSLKSVKGQPVKLIARNGQYHEEFSNKLIELKEDDFLVAIVIYTEGQALSTSLTYLTTLGAGLAEYFINVDTPPEEAINKANTTISEWAGVDINNVTPVDILDVQSAAPGLTKGLRYSFITSAVSVTSAQMSDRNSVDMHVLYNSITFAGLAYEDIVYDGILNGVGGNGVIAMGTVPLTVDTYRKTHALNILAIANHENNLTSIKPEELVYTAELINNSNSIIFGDAPISAFDSNKPIIGASTLIDGKAIYGTYTLNFDVNDLIGIEEITVQLGDETPISVTDFYNPSVDIDTLAVSDGEYPITIIARNFAGGEQTLTRNIIVSNAGIAITNMNPKEGQTVRGVYNFSAEVFDPVGIKSVVFEMDNYIQLAPNGLESPLKIVDTTVTLAKDGHHHFEITATNSVDISVSKNIKFYVDNTAPNFNWSLANNSYITSGYDFNTETTDNLGLASAKLYLDGELLKDFNLNGTATSISAEYYLNPLSFSEGEHNLTYEVFDNAGGSKSVTRTVYIDYLHPQVAITSTGGGYITSSFPINFSASDTNGVKSIKVLINGANASGNLGANTTKFTVNPSSFSEGSKTIKVVVTDMAGKTSESSISKDFRHKAPSLSSPYTSGSAYSYYVKWNLSNVDANEGLSLSVVQVSCTGQKNDGYGTITRTCKKPKVTKEGSSKLTTDVITKTTEGLEGGLCNLKGVFDLKVVDPFGFTKTSRFNASYCY